MKNKLKLAGSILSLVALAWLFNGCTTKTSTSDEKTKEALIAPLDSISRIEYDSLKAAYIEYSSTMTTVEQIVKKGKTYVFCSNNTTVRKFKLILAEKDSKGKLHELSSVIIKSKRCKDLCYTATEDETLYITYQYMHQIDVYWKDVNSITQATVEECDCLHEKKALLPRAGIRADSGGGATVTTTVDEK